jgi:His/Glu/Gln/Arg/opine family amino acid ABC transporter permease subunit
MEVLTTYYPIFLRGMVGTLKYAFIAVALGSILGALISLVTLSKNKVLNTIGTIYVNVLRGTPLLVQMYIAYFFIPIAIPVLNSVSKEVYVLIALILNSSAYVSEIIRGGLMAVDAGQMEAGRSLGLNYVDTMRFIVVPQAVKAILPALGNEFIILLKDTSLITVIGGKEMLYAAQGIISRTYEAMYPLLGIAVMYLVLVMIFSWLLGRFERRLRQSDRR